MGTRSKVILCSIVWMTALTGAPSRANAATGAPPSAPGSSRYHPLTPGRVLDSNTGLAIQTGPLRAGVTYRFRIVGRGGIPASGVSAVMLTATAFNALAGGSLRVYKAGQAAPGF